MSTFRGIKPEPGLEPGLGDYMLDALSNPQPDVKQEPAGQPQQHPSAAAPAPVPGPANANADEDAELKHLVHLEQLRDAELPELLEAGVHAGLQVLEAFKPTLERAVETQGDETEAGRWLKMIAGVQAKAKQNRTVVGVVGSTGAGKSSVINALLDEERLLPTNCMRACTASATEISYNSSDDPLSLYRAEIEFISTEDWVKELHILFSDLLDANGNVSRDSSNSDTDAGVAYERIKAVYPNKTKEMLADSTPERLAKENHVRNTLGSTRKLRDSTSAGIYRQLQNFVDSKEKTAGEKARMEYWPLIKVVKIYTKASALSTGAVIVDLPGVQDSNAARAAVAENYMKACSGLWIVAPINRAVDDKTAKTLLGNNFRRQMKYDGQYSAVTFICSKTDDISVTEASESLNIEEQTRTWETEAQVASQKKAECQTELGNANDEKEAIAECVETMETVREQWDELRDKLADGETVYAPSMAPTKKRKHTTKARGSRKVRSSVDSDDNDGSSDADAASDNDDSQPADDLAEDRQPLTEEEIEDKLDAIKTEMKDLRKKRKEVNDKIKDLKAQSTAADKLVKDANAKIKAACIKGRNDYSRGAIRVDFAAGIKELDQEAAFEEDEEAFNPDEDARDYDEVARSLPVFCASSRAYQKLQGRLQRERFQTSGFETTEDTEIPQLQEHARKLTENGRRADCRVFLNDLIQLVNSIYIWASNDGTGGNLSDKEKRAEDSKLRKQLKELEKALSDCAANCVEQVELGLEETIYAMFDDYVPIASDAAPATAASWGAHRSLGGMYWSTYKATVRREGVWSRDMNAELLDPITKNLANGWEKAFQRRLPAALKDFTVRSKKCLDKFHVAVATRARERGVSFISIQMLGGQLRTHQMKIDSLPGILQQAITDLQRDASRAFTPVIMEEMHAAYQTCVDERGQGSYLRMKNAMAAHVEQARHTMFRKATDTVQDQLQVLVGQVQNTIDAEIDSTYEKIYQDYLQTLVGAKNAKPPSRKELAMRREMLDLVLGVDTIFAAITPETAADVPAVRGDDDDVAAVDAEDDNKDVYPSDDEIPDFSPAEMRDVKMDMGQGDAPHVEHPEEDSDDEFPPISMLGRSRSALKDASAIYEDPAGDEGLITQQLAEEAPRPRLSASSSAGNRVGAPAKVKAEVKAEPGTTPGSSPVPFYGVS